MQQQQPVYSHTRMHMHVTHTQLHLCFNINVAATFIFRKVTFNNFLPYFISYFEPPYLYVVGWYGSGNESWNKSFLLLQCLLSHNQSGSKNFQESIKCKAETRPSSNTEESKTKLTSLESNLEDLKDRHELKSRGSIRKQTSKVGIVTLVKWKCRPPKNLNPTIYHFIDYVKVAFSQNAGFAFTD